MKTMSQGIGIFIGLVLGTVACASSGAPQEGMVDSPFPLDQLAKTKGTVQCDVELLEKSPRFERYGFGNKWFSFTYDESGRIIQYATEQGSAQIMYGNDGGPIYVLTASGVQIPLRTPGGPELVARLRAEGKLPTPDKVLAHHAKRRAS